MGRPPFLVFFWLIVLYTTVVRFSYYQRIDLPAIALAQARQAGMSFTPLSEKGESIAGKTVNVALIKKGIRRIIL